MRSAITLAGRRTDAVGATPARFPLTNGFSSYEEQADGLEAHEAILQVASVALGAAPTALSAVRDKVKQKLASYVNDYVDSLDLG